MAEGARHIAGALAVNQTLTSVGYATRHSLTHTCLSFDGRLPQYTTFAAPAPAGRGRGAEKISHKSRIPDGWRNRGIRSRLATEFGWDLNV